MGNNMVLTIARGYGSGGRTMGRLLSEKLGIRYYDRELLRLASDRSGINEALFGVADEKIRGSFLFKKSGRAFTGEVLGPEDGDFVSDDNLFNIQANVIKDLASKESCVIIGRCADYILKYYSNVISLYCYAPLEDCIARVRDVTGLEDDREIIKKINKIDKYRADYYKYYTRGDWRSVDNYDLCINTSSMGYDELVSVVESYIEASRK